MTKMAHSFTTDDGAESLPIITISPPADDDKLHRDRASMTYWMTARASSPTDTITTQRGKKTSKYTKPTTLSLPHDPMTPLKGTTPTNKPRGYSEKHNKKISTSQPIPFTQPVFVPEDSPVAEGGKISTSQSIPFTQHVFVPEDSPVAQSGKISTLQSIPFTQHVFVPEDSPVAQCGNMFTLQNMSPIKIEHIETAGVNATNDGKTMTKQTTSSPTNPAAQGGNISLKQSIHSAMIANELERLRLYQSDDEYLSDDWQRLYDDVSDLHYAAFYGDFRSVKRLLRDGKHVVDAVTMDGPKLLKHMSASKEKYGQEFAGFFLGTTPLMMASQQGHLSVVQFLIEHHRAKINATDSLGISPLALACASQHIDIVKYLLKKHAYIDIQETRTGMTPFILACVNNHTDVVKILINQHHGNHVTDTNGRHGIHYAAWNYNAELVEYLHTHSQNGGIADINIQDIDGNTPLHLLVSDYDVEPSTIDLINSVREREVVNALLKRLPCDGTLTVDIKRVSQRGAGKPCEEYRCLVKMLRLGAKCTTQNLKNQTVLHVLCSRLTPLKYSRGYLVTDTPTLTHTLLVMMKILLQSGCVADVNLEDCNCNTPLQLCEKRKNWMAVKFLMAGHDITPRTEVTVDLCKDLKETVDKYGWNNLIEAEQMTRNITEMASACLVRQKSNRQQEMVNRLFQ